MRRSFRPRLLLDQFALGGLGPCATPGTPPCCASGAPCTCGTCTVPAGVTTVVVNYTTAGLVYTTSGLCAGSHIPAPQTGTIPLTRVSACRWEGKWIGCNVGANNLATTCVWAPGAGDDVYLTCLSSSFWLGFGSGVSFQGSLVSCSPLHITFTDRDAYNGVCIDCSLTNLSVTQ